MVAWRYEFLLSHSTPYLSHSLDSLKLSTQREIPYLCTPRYYSPCNHKDEANLFLKIGELGLLIIVIIITGLEKSQ